ncbi:MAG: M56 family metallopeptidase [Phycisphaerae bacterium]
MPTVALQTAELLWATALTAIPLAVLVAATCRWLPCRASTRHALWALMLLWFATAPFLPQSPLGDWTAPAATDEPKDVPAQVADVKPSPQPTETTKTIPPRFASAPTNTRVEPPAQPTLPWTMARSKSDLQARLAPAADSSGLSFSTPNRPIRRHSRPDELRRLHRGSVPEAGHYRGPSPKPQEDRFVASRSHPSNPPAVKTPWVGVTSSIPALKTAVTPPIDVDQAVGTQTTAPGPTPSWKLRALAEAWLGWLTGLAAVQAAIVALPPIPAGAWLLGAALLVFICLWRMGSFQRRLSGAVLAPPGVRRMAAQTARQLGLRRVPQVLMIHQRVSPMVWCSRRPRVILPSPLWKQLDDAGRRAILCHELAHLRRGDHWIRWGELLVTACYWWHPLIWWVRRRLHEEADLCCDTWVTWLLPKGRRAYAEALLHTKQYLNDNRVRMPATGMGVTTARAKRFARRLTMVMTHSSRPGLSMPGVLLAVVLASAGWLAVPARSCPPKDGAACNKAPRADAQAAPESTVQAHLAGQEAGPAPSLFRVVADDVSDDESVDRRIEELSALIERLSEELAELAETKADRAIKEAAKAEKRARKHEHKHYAHRPRAPRAPRAPRPPRAPRAPRPPHVDYIEPVPAPDALVEIIPSSDLVVRKYELSECKLKKLTALMVRDDVPIRVRPLPDAIEVHATKAQHAVFAAFVAAIEPVSQVNAYALPEGKLGALTELMVLDSVPVRVAPGSDKIEVHGNGTIQKVFADFVEIIHPTGPGPISWCTPTRLRQRFRCRPDQHAGRVRREVTERLRRRSEITGRVQAEAAAMREQMHRAAEQTRAQSQQKRQEIRQLERTIRTLERRLEKLEQRREEINERAEGLMEEAQAVASTEGDSTEQVLAMERQARELEEQARSLEAQSGSLEREEELLEHDVELLELESDQLEEQAESLLDEAQEAIEARFEAMIEAMEQESESQTQALEQTYERIRQSLESEQEGEAEAARARYQRVIEALLSEQRALAESTRNQYGDLMRSLRDHREQYAQATEEARQAARQLAMQMASVRQEVEPSVEGVVEVLGQTARSIGQQGPEILKNLLQGPDQTGEDTELSEDKRTDESL